MKIIGVTGGKGGTGKSTIATAVAYVLSKKNKVLLVDVDVDCPNDHLIINIDRKELETVYQRIPQWKDCSKCGKCSSVCKTNAISSVKGKSLIFTPAQCNGCGACILVCPENAISWTRKEIGKIYNGKKDNLDFLSGELKINEPVSEFIVDAVKEKINTQKYDYVIIDTAAGTHCDVISALQKCDSVLAVTEPTPLGAHDLELILQLTRLLGKDTKVVVNRADIGDTKLVERIAEKYSCQIVSKIKYSKQIEELYSKGQPLHFEFIKEIMRELENE